MVTSGALGKAFSVTPEELQQYFAGKDISWAGRFVKAYRTHLSMLQYACERVAKGERVLPCGEWRDTKIFLRKSLRGMVTEPWVEEVGDTYMLEAARHLEVKGFNTTQFGMLAIGSGLAEALAEFYGVEVV
jgi:hypothetical protein